MVVRRPFGRIRHSAAIIAKTPYWSITDGASQAACHSWCPRRRYRRLAGTVTATKGAGAAGEGPSQRGRHSLACQPPRSPPREPQYCARSYIARQAGEGGWPQRRPASNATGPIRSSATVAGYATTTWTSPSIALIPPSAGLCYNLSGERLREGNVANGVVRHSPLSYLLMRLTEAPGEEQ